MVRWDSWIRRVESTCLQHGVCGFVFFVSLASRRPIKKLHPNDPLPTERRLASLRPSFLLIARRCSESRVCVQSSQLVCCPHLGRPFPVFVRAKYAHSAVTWFAEKRSPHQPLNPEFQLPEPNSDQTWSDISVRKFEVCRNGPDQHLFPSPWPISQSEGLSDQSPLDI
jgi:hypothetical protein